MKKISEGRGKAVYISVVFFAKRQKNKKQRGKNNGKFKLRRNDGEIV